MEDTRSDAYKEEAALAQMSNFPRMINLENSKDQCTTVSNRLGRLSVGVLGGMYTRQTTKLSSTSQIRSTQSIPEIFGVGSAQRNSPLR